jgi:hypothetical protein
MELVRDIGMDSDGERFVRIVHWVECGTHIQIGDLIRLAFCLRMVFRMIPCVQVQKSQLYVEFMHFW